MSTSAVFLADVASRRLPPPTPEYRFHAERKWRFDYAWPQWKVALEVEGGVFGFKDPKTGKHRSGGAHSSITGIKRDIEKYNYAGAMGWTVIRCLPTTLLQKETLAFVKAALESRGLRKTEDSDFRDTNVPRGTSNPRT